MKRRLILLAASCLIGACTSMHETPSIINSRGVVPRPTVTVVEGQGGYQGDLYQRFHVSANTLAADTTGAADTGAFLQSGFALIYADCDNFFRDMGGSQRSARAARDIISPVVSLVTGIAALNGADSPGENRLLTALSLWSSSTNAGFDIYERHYLFGAENIDAVRELILKAVTVHSGAVFNDPPTTFEDAAVQLIDNQTICAPAHIRRLVREAIRNGEIEPTVTGSAAFQQEFEVRRALGQLLSPPNPLSDLATLNLWKLFIDSGPDKLEGLFPGLASLGDRNPIQETKVEGSEPSYAYRPGWPHESAVVQQLLHLPAETLARYQASLREDAGAAVPLLGANEVAVQGVNASTSARAVQSQQPAARRTTRRVGVSVR